MILSLWMVGMLVSGGPWVLTSHRVIEQCRGRTCLVAPGSPQRTLVQRFPTPQACQAVQQQLQLLGPQTATGALAFRPAECSPFQTLRANPQPASIKEDDLDPVLQAVRENK